MSIRQPVAVWLLFAMLSTIAGNADAESKASTARPAAIVETLDLETVLAKVRQENLELAAARGSIDVAQGLQRQASLLPNPE